MVWVGFVFKKKQEEGHMNQNKKDIETGDRLAVRSRVDSVSCVMLG